MQTIDINSKDFLDTIFHYCVVPAAIFIASKLGNGVKAGAKKYAKEAVSETVQEMFAARSPVLKQMMDDSNDALLVKINGTYVRSREQQIRDQNVIDRLERIETKLDAK